MPRAAGLMVSAVMVARFAAGCAADVVDERDVAESNSALKGTALNGATVTGVPVPGTTSKLTWPSTYPRLLAADAMAECTLIQRVGITDGGTTDPDPFFAGL
ncbi:MAG TPA: hypothetical protein VHM19_22275, partial [Polyangiales bacterium]|nr:hypothetical protein [Polyangiales bacterium]